MFSFFHSEAHAFWSRPEPFLILIAVLTLSAAYALPPWTAAVTIGVLAGCATGYKLHGSIYALPAALAIFGTAETWAKRLGMAAVSFFVLVSAATLPFLLRSGSAQSIQGYISTLLLTAEHGLSPTLLIENTLFTLTLSSPIILVWYFRRPIVGSFESWFLVGRSFPLLWSRWSRASPEQANIIFYRLPLFLFLLFICFNSTLF